MLTLILLLAPVLSAHAVEMHACTPASEAQKPVLLWSTKGFSKPESVVFDARSKTYFVSNLAGGGKEKDGIGWISKLDSRGKIVKARWVQGLNAPKGLAIQNDLLWVSDIDSIAAFDLKAGKRAQLIQVPGAQFLNDVVASKTQVFVTDMMTNRIHAVEGDAQHVFMQGAELDSPNGITFSAQGLLLASWGHDLQPDFSTPTPGRVFDIDLQTKAMTAWTAKPLGNLDGLERDGTDAVIVSDWNAGKVFHLKRSGECRILLEGFKGSADLTFLPDSRTLVLPLMGEDRVVAYRVPMF